MSRLTRQEQVALWILLLLLVGGAAGRYWIRHLPPDRAAASARP
jgi:hypothetical protein